MASPQTANIFVVGPIGNKHAPLGSESLKSYEEGLQVLNTVIKPACSEHGLEAFRADEIHEMGEVDEQIFRLLRDSPIVIADLSGLNPNVMYELGARHTTGKLTIPLMAMNNLPAAGLPFDVNAIRTILFPRTPEGLKEARERTSKALAAGLLGRGSPVTLTRIWLENPDDRIELAVQAASDSERGSIEKSAILSSIRDAVLNLRSIEQGMNAGTSILMDMSTIFSSVSNTFREAKAQGRRTDPQAALIKLKGDLLDPAERLDVVSIDMSLTTARLHNLTSSLLERLRSTPGGPTSYPNFLGMVKSLRTLASAATLAREQVRDFYKVAEGFREAPYVGVVFARLQRTLRRLENSLVEVSEVGPLLSEF